MKSIIEAFDTWRAGVPSYSWPPINFGGDMTINDRLDEVEATLKEMFDKYGCYYGSYDQILWHHLTAIRRHIKEQDAVIAGFREDTRMRIMIREGGK